MKKILLVADQKGWIFERHCREIQKRLTEYKIDIAYHKQDIAELSKNYDCVYICDPMPMTYPPAEKTIMGLRCEFLYKEHPEGARGLYEKGLSGRCVSIKDKCSIFHVVNKNQMKAFKDIVLARPLLLVQHGIDENIFNMKKHFRKIHDRLTVSIAGRGTCNKAFGLVRKVCKEMNIECISASYKGKQLSKEEMPLFYNGADVHVCMSRTEGLNNAILEAGAMGLPIISTRCGASEEIIRDGDSGFLINRNGEELKRALVKMKDDNLRLRMGGKMYQEIMNNWIWKKRIEDFRKMFKLYFKINET